MTVLLRLSSGSQAETRLPLVLDRHVHWIATRAPSYRAAVEATIMTPSRQLGGRTRVELQAICDSIDDEDMAILIDRHKSVYDLLGSFNGELFLDGAFPFSSAGEAFCQEYDRFKTSVQLEDADWIVSSAGSFSKPDARETGTVITIVNGWVILAVENTSVENAVAPYDLRLMRVGDTM